MSLSCYIKSTGFTFYEVARRIPRLLWEIIKVLTVTLIPSILPLLTTAIFIIIVTSYVPMGRYLDNPVADILCVLLLLSLIFSLVMVFVSINAHDFRTWSRYFGKPCNEGTYKEYHAFKKSLGVSYIGTAFYYNISMMEIVPVKKRD